MKMSRSNEESPVNYNDRGSYMALTCCWHWHGIGERIKWFSLKKPAVEEAKICMIALLYAVWDHVWRTKPDYI